MDRAQWEARRKYLGASEVPAVCGLDPFKTAADIWAHKKGYAELTTSAPAEIGHLLEPVLLEEYGRRYGVKVERPATIVRGYRAATPDGLVPGKSLQVKVVGYHMAHHWREGVPDYVQAQVQAEMSLADVQQAVVIVLLGTQLDFIPVDRDDAAIAAIDRICARFWRRYVVGNDRPDIAQSRNASDILRKMYPRHAGMKAAVPEFVALARRYAQLGRAAAEAQKEREQLAISMKLAIGDGAGFEWESGRVTLNQSLRVTIKGEDHVDDGTREDN